MPVSRPTLSRAQASRVRELSRDKCARQAEGTFIVEGAKAVRDVLHSHPRLVRMVVTAASYCEQGQVGDRLIPDQGVPRSFSCEDRIFASLSGLDSPQGILAVVEQPVWNEKEVLARSSLLGLYGEHLQDPLNVGTIIRTAAALDVSAVWLTPDSADRYNPKVVRATGGALLSLPVFTSEAVEDLVNRDCALYAAEPPGFGSVEIHKVKKVPRRLILAVGNEGQGLSENTRKLATYRFTIPLSRNVESLNVAATVAIAIHYFSRLPHLP